MYNNFKKKLMGMFIAFALSLLMMPVSVLANDKEPQATIGDTAYDTIEAAFEAAADGQTIVLKQNVTLNPNKMIKVFTNNESQSKTITLDLHGFDFTAADSGWKSVIKVGYDGSSTCSNATLKITGKGDLKKTDSTYAMISVDADQNGAGTLDLSAWESGEITMVLVCGDSNSSKDATFIGPKSERTKIGTLNFSNIQHDLKVGLMGGSYGKILYSSGRNDSITMAMLLADGYAFKKTDGSFVSYDSKIQSGSSLENVSVVKCNLYMDANEDKKCDYCNADISAASSAAVVTTTSGNTYYFLAESGENETKTIDSALKYASDHDGSIKLLEDNLTLKRANCKIDLNGKSGINIETGGANLLVFGTGTVKYLEACSLKGILKGGTYIIIRTTADTSLGDLLADGYGFKDEDGSWLKEEKLAQKGGELLSDVETATVAQLPITDLKVSATTGGKYGNTLTLKAEATKLETYTDDVTYQWYQDNEELEGKTGNTVTLSNLSYKEGGYTFKCVATLDNYSLSKEVKKNVTGVLYELKTGKDTSGLKKTYDGTTDMTDEVPETLEFYTDASSKSSVKLTKGTDYTVKAANFGDATAGEEKSITATIELTNGNYIFDNGTKEKKFDSKLKGSIKEAKAPLTTDGALEVTNDLKKTYTYDLTTLLPKLIAPATYGEITYGEPVVDLKNGYYTSGAVIDENGVLSLPILQVNTTKEGKIGQITVRVNTKNYEKMTLVLNIKAANKSVPAETTTENNYDTTKKNDTTTNTITGTKTNTNAKTKTKTDSQGNTVTTTFVNETQTVFKIKVSDEVKATVTVDTASGKTTAIVEDTTKNAGKLTFLGEAVKSVTEAAGKANVLITFKKADKSVTVYTALLTAGNILKVVDKSDKTAQVVNLPAIKIDKNGNAVLPLSKLSGTKFELVTVAKEKAIGIKALNSVKIAKISGKKGDKATVKINTDAYDSSVKKISYKSLDRNIVNVNSNGEVSFKASGKARIKVTIILNNRQARTYITTVTVK